MSGVLSRSPEDARVARARNNASRTGRLRECFMNGR